MTHTPLLARLTERLEELTALDPLVARARTVVAKALPSQRVRDLLHGVRLGHPLHPALIAVPLGSFTSVAVLDALPGTGPAANALLISGLVGALPSAAAGWADWQALHEQQQRVGLVHAVANITALGAYAVSLASRRGGREGRGKVWAYAGLALVAAGGYLGGHLAYRQAAGANHVEDVPHRVPPGWHAVGELAALPEGRPAHRSLGGVDLIVVRTGPGAQVLAGLCSHLSAPLWDGELAGGCLTCPWHGSVFRIADGAVVHGPATSPQPHFRTRVRQGRLEVCLPGAG